MDGETDSCCLGDALGRASSRIARDLARDLGVVECGAVEGAGRSRDGCARMGVGHDAAPLRGKTVRCGLARVEVTVRCLLGGSMQIALRA